MLERFSKKYFATRSAWRTWLQKHHSQKEGIWLVYDKGPGRRLSGDDITEEAICFGWIDSLPRALDAKRSMLFLAPRKPKSNWSKLNRERAARMIKLGKMRPAGMATIRLAKKTGTWGALKDVQNSALPADLVRAFRGQQRARANFDAFPPSSKRIILEWVHNAKKPETRKARIDETVRLAKKNIKANHYRQ